MNLKGFYFLDFLSLSFRFRKTEKGDPWGGVWKCCWHESVTGGPPWKCASNVRVLLAYLGSAPATWECCWRTTYRVRQQQDASRGPANIAGVPQTVYASNMHLTLADPNNGTPATPSHWRTKFVVRQQGHVGYSCFPTSVCIPLFSHACLGEFHFVFMWEIYLLMLGPMWDKLELWCTLFNLSLACQLSCDPLE